MVNSGWLIGEAKIPGDKAEAFYGVRRQSEAATALWAFVIGRTSSRESQLLIFHFASWETSIWGLAGARPSEF